MMEFNHTPVLLSECIDALKIKKGGVYVDATLGGAGHSEQIVKGLDGKGTLIGIDRDLEAIEAAKERLKGYICNKIFIHGNYADINTILDDLELDNVDGILADLGVSSYQLDNPARGFSYRYNAPLNMRMDNSQTLSARDVVNNYSVDDLTRILRDYGEERYARAISVAIAKSRAEKPIETTHELVGIIDKTIPAKYRFTSTHSAAKTFQGIRIEVNQELSLLEEAVKSLFLRLKSGGRLAVISFHSLEDRIIKNCFAQFARGCICPKEFPICICKNSPKGKIITKKPIVADETELNRNSRSKSAKLRIIEKI